MATLWSWLPGATEDAAYALLAALLAVLLILILVLLALQVLTRVRGLRDWWPAKYIRRPTLEIKELRDTAVEPHMGAAVAGLIRGHVTWRRDRFGLNAVSGQAGIASAFSGLGDASKHARAAVAVVQLLSALLPRRRFELCGELQPAGARGPGISLELAREGGFAALITFWASTFNLDKTATLDVYQQLATASAAWVDIWMAKSIGDDGGELLTKDPLSWVFFRCGLEAQQLGEPERARHLYEHALAHEGANAGALANLGILCRRAGRYADAKEYLKRAVRAIEGPESALRPSRNPDWYRIKFQIAALHLNWATESGLPGDAQQRRALAATEARDLATCTLDTLAVLRNPRRRDRASDEFSQNTLKPFLEGTIEASALILVASTVLDPSKPAPEGWREQTPEGEEALRRLLDDEPIEPWPLIAFVEHGTNRPPAVLFNLACFYSRVYDLSTASRHLLAAFRETAPPDRTALIEVAERDPALARLHYKRPGLMPTLRALLDPAPKMDANEQVAQKQFDLQNRAYDDLDLYGWAITWGEPGSRFDLKAAKDGQRLLVEVPDVRSELSERDVEATIGGLATTGDGTARARVLIDREVDVTHVDLALAREHGVEVWAAGADGVHPLNLARTKNPQTGGPGLEPG